MTKMKITKRQLQRIIKEELSRVRINEISARQKTRIERQLEKKWRDAFRKHSGKATAVGTSYGINAAVDHLDKLKDRGTIDEAEYESLGLFVKNIGGENSLTSLIRDEESIEDLPDEEQSEAEQALGRSGMALVHEPTTAGGPSAPRIVRTGQTADAERFTVSTSAGEMDYTRAMGDILAGQKVLRVGSGGNKDKNSDDPEKKKTWAQVKIIQALLIAAEYANGLFTKADGDYGGLTKKAVERMQKDLKLQVDGKVGRQTATAFNPRKKAQDIPITGQEISQEVEEMVLNLPPGSLEGDKPAETEETEEVVAESARRWAKLAGILEG